MNNLVRKLCLFLFITAVLAGRNNALGVLTGGITGAILLWPVYLKLLLPIPTALPRRRAPVEPEEVEAPDS